MLINESQFLNLSSVIHYAEIIGSVLKVSTLIEWKTEKKNKLEVLKKLLGRLGTNCKHGKFLCPSSFSLEVSILLPTPTGNFTARPRSFQGATFFVVKQGNEVLKEDAISEFSRASISKRVQVRNHSYENEFCMRFHFHSNQSHFHKNGFALTLALKQRHKGTRKCPIKL